MRKIRFTAFILSVIMLITFMPISVMKTMADGIRDIDLSSQTEQINDVGETVIESGYDTDSYISEELTEKRTADSKLFLLENGTIVQQQFPIPVHYKDGETFKEIDNTLDLKTSETGESYFENRANDFRVRLPEFTGNTATMSVEKEGYGLFFFVNDKSGESVLSSKAEMDEKRETANATAGRNKTPGTDVVNDLLLKRKDPLQPNVGESCLTYKSVFKNVDFNYSVGSFGVKENIFVYAPLPEYVFDFTIRATGLILTSNENGEIFACNEDGEAIFLIPAPNMTDADGNYSESVCYELTQEDDDSYVLSVRAEKDWLNDSERSFPVKIDPAVYPVGKQTADSLTFYYGDKTGTEYNRARIRFGKSDSGICGGLISFPNDKNRFCSSGYRLAYGKLNYYVRSVGSGEAGTTDYHVRSIKTTIPLEKMTGLDSIEKSDSPVLLNGSVAAGKSLSGKVTSDGRWEEVYFTPESFGDSPDYVFLWEAVASNENQYGEVDIRDGNLPSVLSYYVSTVGIREDLPYEQFEYNGGTASVNLINGALTSAFDVLSIDVAQNPLSLQLVYNDSYDDIMTEYGMYNMFGKNIKINFQQLIKCDSGSARYIDEDGSVETFFSCNNGTYRSVDKNLSFLPSGATLYVNGNTKMYFSDDRVTAYHDASDIVAEKTMYKIKYSGNRITGIDGYTNNKKTHYIDFSYSDGVVTSAAAYLSTAVDGGSFRNIAECVFIYDDDGHLTEIRNNNSGNKKFVLGYDGDRLTGITDFDGNGYLFGRTHWSDSSPMRMSSVHSTYGDKSESGSCFYNYNGYTTFSAYDPKITKTEYYDAEEKKIGERNVDRCFGDTASSEWYVDDKGGNLRFGDDRRNVRK